MEYKTKHYNKDFDFTNPEFIKFKNETTLDELLKYNEDDYIKILKNILFNNGIKKTIINKKYFDIHRYNTLCNSSKYTVLEILKSDTLLSIMFNIINTYKMFINVDNYKQMLIITFNLKTSSVTGSPSCYNIKKCKELLKKYNTNNIYYDPSAGWGDRMLSAAALGLEYYSTDPNTPLVDSLNLLGQDINIHKDFNYKIYNQGSEVYIPELFDKVGLIFTSPPYFNFEKYENGNQLVYSSINYYKEYIKQTVFNCSRYLIEDGYFCININNKYYDLFYNEAIKYGLTFITDEYYVTTNTNRNTDTNKEKNTYTEKIMIFQKKF
jgi:hypothetical protein